MSDSKESREEEIALILGSLEHRVRHCPSCRTRHDFDRPNPDKIRLKGRNGAILAYCACKDGKYLKTLSKKDLEILQSLKEEYYG